MALHHPLVEPETLRVKKFLAQQSPPLVAMFIRSLAWSLRIRLEDPQDLLNHEPAKPKIIAFWHNRILMMPYLCEFYLRGRRCLTLVSRSRDGEFITQVMSRFGIDGVRGSSSKGGLGALRTMIRELEQTSSRDIVITPDGPRGPKYHVQDGVLAVAAASGRPILPATVHFSRKWELPSWDRFQIPQPGAICRLVIGPLVPAPKSTDPRTFEPTRKKLAKVLGV